MDLPVPLGTAPMLARLARSLPDGPYCFEPKWDGFRALVFRDGADIEIRSRNQRPFARYFPEVVAALRPVVPPRFVLDGEIVATRDAQPDFAALLLRLHPSASRVERLRVETPATFIAFDVLARGDDDVRAEPFVQRRAVLEDIMASAAPDPARVVTVITDDRAVAREWLEQPRDGIDGVVAKHRDLRYESAKRAMIKVKRERTLDCVVAGARLADRDRLASLLLGLYGDDGVLHSVGVVAGFSRALASELWRDVRACATTLAGHPWEHGLALTASPIGRLRGAAGRWTPDMELDWVPLVPALVCEVAYDHFDHDRFRHPPRWRRWRPDRDARSCTFAQVATVTA